MNYKPTIANIEKFMYCRAVENFKRGYKYRTQFELDKLIYFDIQSGQWENSKRIYNVKRRDYSSVISILRQALQITQNANEIHEIKYIIQVLSDDRLFNREMNTYEEESKNDNRTKN